MDTGAVYLSPRGCEILGYSADEMATVAATWDQLVCPDDLPATQAALDAYLEGRVPTFDVEQRLRTASGGWKWIRARGAAVARDASGAPTRMVGTHSDISAQRAAEDALRLSAARLRRTVERTVEAMGAMIAARDPYTADHEKRVTELAVAIAVVLDRDDVATEGLRLAGLVHDIGKLTVPAEILNKPSRLTRDRVRADQGSRRGGLRDPQADRVRLPRGRHRRAAPRAPGRLGVPGGAHRRRDPAGGAHPGGRRRGRGDGLAPAVPGGPWSGGGARRGPAKARARATTPRPSSPAKRCSRRASSSPTFEKERTPDAGPSHRLADLVDLERLQPRVRRPFPPRAAWSLAVLEPDGTIVLASGWQDICTQFHRAQRRDARRAASRAIRR